MMKGRWWTLLLAVSLTILGFAIYDFGFKKRPELKIEYHEIEEIVHYDDAGAYKVYYLNGIKLEERLLWKSKTVVHVGTKEEAKSFFIAIPGRVYTTYEIYIKKSEIKELIHSGNKIVPVINKGEQR